MNKEAAKEFQELHNTMEIKECPDCGLCSTIETTSSLYVDCYMKNDPYEFPTATYEIPYDAEIEIIRKQAERYFDNVVFTENTNGQSTQLCPKEWLTCDVKDREGNA